jgi:hypothetical protein
MENHMNRDLAKQIIQIWSKSPFRGYVLKQVLREGQLFLEGYFTPEELKAFAWCMENKVRVSDLKAEK